MDDVMTQQQLILGFAGFGLTLALLKVFKFVSSFYKIFLRGGYNLKKKYGGWAVVTGCTDGIGRAFCEQLAKKNIPLLLISRTESKLKVRTKTGKRS